MHLGYGMRVCLGRYPFLQLLTADFHRGLRLRNINNELKLIEMLHLPCGRSQLLYADLVHKILFVFIHAINYL